MGGDFIREQNLARGGETSHACMPGCLIKCSNVYADAEGNEVVSPVEYETIGLMGTNCGLSEPDELAHVNYLANNLGIDTIEAGAMIGVLMEAGLAEFGDFEFICRVLDEIANGSEEGKLWAQGTARVGEHYQVKRVPVIKKQAISAYDPRVIEVTGISMMVTAQGADHTVGNAPSFPCDGKDIETLVLESLKMQINSAVADSLGLCVFGRTVTDVNLQLIADAVNNAFGLEIDPAFIRDIGLNTLKLENRFNQQAGFGDDDHALPEFFHSEPLMPTGKMARLNVSEIKSYLEPMMESVPSY